LRFSDQASGLGPLRKGLSRVCPMLKCIGVAARRARPLRPAMHTARLLPATAGERQGAPERVRAPQRGLLSLGTVFRLWVLAIAV
jgi:hypothetical protein